MEPHDTAPESPPEVLTKPPKAPRRKDRIIESLQPPSPLEPYRVKIPEENRNSIGWDLMTQINAGISDRDELGCNLDYYEKLYEMHVEKRMGPSPYSSNIFLPLVPNIVDTMTSRLAAMIFQPRFFVVNGNTQEASQVQALVERGLNADLARYQWVEPLYIWLQQSLIYGNGILGVFWKRKVSKRKKIVYEPAVDSVSGAPIPDVETGQQLIEKRVVDDPVTDFDDVELTPIPFKEFVVFPVWAQSIDSALAVARKVRLSEQQLNAMVRAKLLWENEVEAALSYNPEGIDERPMDEQGTAEINADNQLTISSGTINQSPYRRQRGPLEIWQIHTNQYDMDNDGEYEENIFWVHEQSMRCLGYDAYSYWHGHRPYVSCIPMPRDQAFPGYAVPERLRTLQAELNTTENQKNDARDRAISPTLVYSRGAECKTQDNRIGPGAEWEVDGQVGTSINFLQSPDAPLSSWQEQQWLIDQAMTMMGLNAPMMGQQSSSRRSRGEVMLQAQSAGVRLDLIANRVRQAMKEVAWQIVQLKIQYGPEQEQIPMPGNNGVPQRLILSKRDLAQDLDIDIIGAGGPLDKTNRQEDTMILYSLLMKNPLVLSSLVRVYNVTQMMLEAHDRPDVQALIGTQEDAQKTDQARQKQQAMFQKLQLIQGLRGQQQGQQQGLQQRPQQRSHHARQKPMM